MKKVFITIFLVNILLFSHFVYVSAATENQVEPQSSWANVNRIDLGQFDSGVVELRVGQTITVTGTINFSGDKLAIDQAIILFTDIDSALSINYDGNLTTNGNTGTFTFTITLISNENRPHTFKVAVADSSPNDDNHLTPYSDTQTILAADDSSTTETSTTETSTTESSTTESSTTESSTTESSTSESNTSESNTSEPSTTESSTSESNTSEPSTTESSTSDSDTSEPSTTKSSTSESNTSETSTTESSKSDSNTSEPSTTESNMPETSKLESSTSESNTSGLPKAGENNQPYLVMIGNLLLGLGVFLVSNKYVIKK